jgi:NADH-quinone oxidoreductase subunit L
MMWPLYILAAFSLLFGFLAGPRSPLGGYPFRDFLEPSVAPLSVGPLSEGKPLFPEEMGYIISSIVAIAGILLAYFRYNSHRATGQLMSEESKARNPLYNFLLNKWHFDTVYNAIFIRGGGALANVLWKAVDVGMIDRFVNLLAEIIAGISRTGRRLQTGYVRNYVMAMMIGAVGLVIALLISWNRLTG